MTVTLGLVVLAVVAFFYAAVRFQASQQAPQLAVALGLAFLALAIGVTAGLPPPIPPDPGPQPPTSDFGGYRPHLQGWGATTRGGRGGEVRIIGTRDPGELAAAVAGRPGCADTWQTCARVVVFSVSGTWDLASLGQLSITSPFLTVACQTAPAGGVTFSGARFLIDTHDVVVQHCRTRKPPVSLNALSVGDAGDGGDNSHVRNVIIDHVSVSWAQDVNNYLQAGPGSTNVMLTDSLIYEGLWTGALGGIGAGVGGDFTVMRTVFAHHWSRQPIFGSPCRGILANNVVYNGTTPYGSDSLPGFFGDLDGDGSSPSSCQSMVLWNVLLPGPDSGQPTAFLGFSKKSGSLSAGSKAFMEGNSGPGGNAPGGDQQWAATVCEGSYGAYPNAATCGPSSNMRTNDPFPWWADFKIATLTTNVRNTVLASAGARPKDRDTADARVIADVTEGDGTHYLDWAAVQSRYGGMPTIASQTRTLPLPENPNAPGTRTLADGSKNTVLEDWLESEARRVEPAR